MRSADDSPFARASSIDRFSPSSCAVLCAVVATCESLPSIKHLHLDLLAANHAIGVVRRDAQADLGATRGHRTVKRLFVVNLFDDIEPPRILDRRDQLASVAAAVQVEYHRRNVLDLSVDGIAKDDRLHHRHDEHEEQAWSAGGECEKTP